MRLNRFTICILLTTAIFLTGCKHCLLFTLHPINYTFARHSNPIADWKYRPFDNYAPPYERTHYHLDQAIVEDYQNFIADKKKFPYPPNTITGFFEDGKGQRAVALRIGIDGTSWVYVLIYDRDNKRVKVIKYVDGYYMC